MASPDPDFWQEAAKHLWAALALPIGYVWKKANGAVQKEDFKDAIKDISEVIKEHAEQDEKKADQTRETFIKIFERLEKQGEVLNRVDATVTFISKNGHR